MAKPLDKSDFVTHCPGCGVEVIGRAYAKSTYKRNGGKFCKECLNKKSSDTLKKVRASQTPEEKSEHAKRARALVSKEKMSIAVKKGWDTVRADKEKYKKIKEERSKASKKRWREEYSEDKKQRILNKLTSSNNCGRSILSDQVKSLMEEEGITGFASEGYFHGFFPDEINHELKIIVEVYGDIYHCHPDMYKDEDEYLSHIQRTVKQQRHRDKKRLACFYKHGYSVVIIWEKDFKKDKVGQINRIKDEINRRVHWLI